MKKLFTIMCAIIACVCLGIFAACGNDESVAVESVTLNKTELTLNIGESETLTATISPDNATVKTVTWESSETSVATVAEGKVTAVSEGTAIITAKAGDKSAICTVVVSAAQVNVKLSENEWKAAVQATLDAKNMTINLSMPYTSGKYYLYIYEFDGSKVCMTSLDDSDSWYYSFENGKIYIYNYYDDNHMITEDAYWHKEEYEAYSNIDEIINGILSICGLTTNWTYSENNEISGTLIDIYAAFSYDETEDCYKSALKYSYDSELAYDCTVSFVDGKINELLCEMNGTIMTVAFTYGTTYVTLPTLSIRQ